MICADEHFRRSTWARRGEFPTNGGCFWRKAGASICAVFAQTQPSAALCFPEQGVCGTGDVQGCEGEEREDGSRIGRKTASGLKVDRREECALKSGEKLEGRFPYGKDGGNRDAANTFRKHSNALQGL